MSKKYLGKAIAGAALGGASLLAFAPAAQADSPQPYSGPVTDGTGQADHYGGQDARRSDIGHHQRDGRLLAKPRVVKAGDRLTLVEVCTTPQRAPYAWAEPLGVVHLRPAGQPGQDGQDPRDERHKQDGKDPKNGKNGKDGKEDRSGDRYPDDRDPGRDPGRDNPRPTARPTYAPPTFTPPTFTPPTFTPPTFTPPASTSSPSSSPSTRQPTGEPAPTVTGSRPPGLPGPVVPSSPAPALPGGPGVPGAPGGFGGGSVAEPEGGYGDEMAAEGWVTLDGRQSQPEYRYWATVRVDPRAKPGHYEIKGSCGEGELIVLPRGWVDGGDGGAGGSDEADLARGVGLLGTAALGGIVLLRRRRTDEALT